MLFLEIGEKDMESNVKLIGPPAERDIPSKVHTRVSSPGKGFPDRVSCMSNTLSSMASNKVCPSYSGGSAKQCKKIIKEGRHVWE